MLLLFWNGVTPSQEYIFSILPFTLYLGKSKSFNGFIKNADLKELYITNNWLKNVYIANKLVKTAYITNVFHDDV